MINDQSITILIVRPTVEGGWEHLQLRRTDSLREFWSLCRGSVEPGETHLQAAARELGEETGFSPPEVEFYSLGTLEQFYSHLFESICFSPAFAAIAPAQSEPRLNDEHSHHRWVPDSLIEHELLWPSELPLIHVLRRCVLHNHRVKPLLRIPDQTLARLLE